ncbi:hypothetical protein [Leptospira sp. 'Mane']|uniref:hypothetical protein n=1 Tax=Leptospira sp. 'Mane' TaxID=3387407 RepID=UPI00398B24F3
MNLVLNNELKLIVITRRDLKPGDQGTQSIHVVSDYMLKYGRENSALEWKEKSNSVVWLSCKDEEELKKLSLAFNEITLVKEFYEPDLGYDLTAICFIADYHIRKKVSSLPLALKQAN